MKIQLTCLDCIFSASNISIVAPPTVKLTSKINSLEKSSRSKKKIQVHRSNGLEVMNK